MGFYSRWVLVAALTVVGATGTIQGASPTAPHNAELRITADSAMPLEEGWNNPPQLARTRCWWWWLNGNVTKDAITRDLEEMKDKGLGGASIIDAGGAEQNGHR